MALQSSGAISMSEIRTEIGTSGAISMSDLYRVNTSSEFPTSIEVTDGISSVSYSGVSSATLGYSNRYMYGDLTTYSGGIGAGGTFAYGFMYNNLALSSVFDTRLINNGGITGSNYVSGGYANHVLFHLYMFFLNAYQVVHIQKDFYLRFRNHLSNIEGVFL